YENVTGKPRTDKDIPWLKMLNSAAGTRRYVFETQNSFTRATVGITFSTEEGGRATYVAAFGLGADSIIDKRKLVYDFGIKVAMNICDIDKLRRIQTTAHEAVSRQTERQASTGTNLAVFGVNTETELLRMLSGIVASPYKGIIDTFRGKENISLKLPKNSIADLVALIALCRSLEERYKSDDYKSTDLRIYDQLRIENDPVVTEALDAKLVALVAKKDFAHVHLAPPDFMEGEDTQFAYERKTDEKTPEAFDDLRMDDLVGIPGRRQKGITANTLKSWNIYRIDEDSNITYRLWSAYRCMVAEVDHESNTYVLSNGQWRQVSGELKAKVDSYL
ncbi:MAG: hypothetical protein EOP06_32485, partial [Proteobacteria bacterium]